MKIWVLLALLFSCQAAVIFTPRNPDDVGAAVTFNNQDALGSYDFGYSEGHPSGSSFRRETGDAAGNKIGSFGLRDADGRLRIVRYVADANGFRADVTSNEPGVASQDPASATINKPAIVPLPAAPVAPVALPPPPPPAIPVQPIKALPPPPPPQYNYIYSAPAPVAPARVSVAPAPLAVAPAPFGVASTPVAAPPPPAYYRPVAPIATAPIAVAPVAKSFAAYGPPPPPPPPPTYYSNLVQGKGYLGSIRNYASLLPPFAAVPPQFGYVRAKSLPTYQALGYPL